MIKALRNFSEEFQEMFKGPITLTKTLGDKTFLAMFNLYFFNLSKGI
jgi:hypothetical protein